MKSEVKSPFHSESYLLWKTPLVETGWLQRSKQWRGLRAVFQRMIKTIQSEAYTSVEVLQAVDYYPCESCSLEEAPE